MDAQLQNQVVEQSTKPQSDIVIGTSSLPSSPSHEFSFTNSLNPSSKLAYKAVSSSSFVVDDDLSPADHIFFHGHLLPLQFLSHLPHFPITPRSSSTSTDSSDSFSLPIRPDELEEIKGPEKCNDDDEKNNYNKRRNCGRKGGIKGKSWALLWSGKWIRRSAEVGEKEKVKMKFQVSNVLRKYLRTIRPVLLFRRRKKKGKLREQVDDSFSCNSSLEEMQQWEGDMGFSAHPSPAKHGSPFSPITLNSNNTSNSTMVELQSAIQAAILYCKNSIAKEDHEKLIRQD
ncbi:hypothetical protein Scep_001630 [Stephania cephalantha]|uniref:BRI1 kinase inhibitor 1-like n=1 Tax=Stephania cephalantha TaxID=152367 RepID=A0AAP0LCC9_9MAGN